MPFGSRTPIAAFVAVVFFIWGMMGVLIGAVLPDIIADLGLASSQAGAIFVLWSVGFVCGSILAGWLIERFGVFRLVGTLVPITGLLLLVIATSAGLWQILLGYALTGLAGGATFTAGHTLYGRLFADRRSSALGLLDLSFSFGNLCAPLMVSALFHYGFGWQASYGVICSGFFVVYAVLLSNGRHLRGALPGDGDDDGDGHADGRSGHGGRFMAAVLTPVGLTLALCSFLLGFVEWAQNVWFVTYASFHIVDGQDARLAMAFFVGGMIAARIAVIALGDQAKAAPFISLLCTVMLIGAAAILIADDLRLLSLGTVLLGFGIGALLPVILGSSMDRHPGRSASYSAIVITFLTLGGQVSSLFIGLVSDHVGLFAAFRTVYVVPVLLVSSVSALFLMLRRGGRLPSSQ